MYRSADKDEYIYVAPETNKEYVNNRDYPSISAFDVDSIVSEQISKNNLNWSYILDRKLRSWQINTVVIIFEIDVENRVEILEIKHLKIFSSYYS